jgi:hypothetical protein
MAVIDPAALRAFRRRFGGRVPGPDDPVSRRAPRLEREVDRRPAVIARCGGRDDVVAAVSITRRAGLRWRSAATRSVLGAPWRRGKFGVVTRFEFRLAPEVGA